MENRMAKAALDKKHLLSNKMISFTKMGILKQPCLKFVFFRFFRLVICLLEVGGS